MKLILITSTSLQNKGDALMVSAIVNRFGPAFRYALPSNVTLRRHSSKAKYLTCLSVDRPATTVKRKLFAAAISALSILTTLCPRSVYHRLGVVREKDVDIVIDASGYCYGDHWGERLLNKAAKEYAVYKSRGIPVVLMPKTWGPFETINHDSVDSLLASVEVAFARDETSMATLKAAVSPKNAEKVFFAPDYTHEATVSVQPSDRGHSESKVTDTFYIIPSYRVIDSHTMTPDRYLSLIREAREAIVASGAKVLLLIHESASDGFFAKAAVELGFNRSDVITETDPIALKTLIAGSRGVVTSRLHGLYNALNTGIPVLVIPWNFKYEEALRQYGCEAALIDMRSPSDSLRKKLPLILNEPSRTRLSQTMLHHGLEVRNQTNNMWSRIFRVLGIS